MPDKKLTDNEIFKAIECCADGDCRDCPYYGTRCENHEENVLSLVKRQKAEIDRLNIELQAMRGAANSYKAELARAEKKHVEWEELKVFCPFLVASARGATPSCGENRCAWWVPGGRGKCAIKEIAEYIGCEGRGTGRGE